MARDLIRKTHVARFDRDPIRPAVLFVDDEEKILRAFSRLFRGAEIEVHTAHGAGAALEILERHPVQVVVSDLDMPEVSGSSFLRQVRARWPDRIRILLTGEAGIDAAVEAVNQAEVYRLVTKPWNNEDLRANIEQALDWYVLQIETARLTRENEKQSRSLSIENLGLRKLNEQLRVEASRYTAELAERQRERRQAQLGTLQALAAAIDAHDPYTRGHSERVAVYASKIARELKSESDFIERIYVAGLLHDVGKIGIADSVINKPGPLTPEEYAQVQKHPEIGARILAPIPFLEDVVPCVRHHHEWYDGSSRGYPDRLRGSEIPLPSRIILVADTVEAMSSSRPYRAGLPLWRVTQEIRNCRGTQFDPVIADAFLRIIEREGERFIEQASRFDLEEFLSEDGFER